MYMWLNDSPLKNCQDNSISGHRKCVIKMPENKKMYNVYLSLHTVIARKLLLGCSVGKLSGLIVRKAFARWAADGCRFIDACSQQRHFSAKRKWMDSAAGTLWCLQSGIRNQYIRVVLTGGQKLEFGCTVKVGKYYGVCASIWKLLFLLPRTGQVAPRLSSNQHGAAEAEPPLGRWPRHPYLWEGTFSGAFEEPGLGLSGGKKIESRLLLQFRYTLQPTDRFVVINFLWPAYCT